MFILLSEAVCLIFKSNFQTSELHLLWIGYIFLQLMILGQTYSNLNQIALVYITREDPAPHFENCQTGMHLGTSCLCSDFQD